MCISIIKSLSLSLYIYIYIYTHFLYYIYVLLCVCVCVCVYIYIYIYTRTKRNICTYKDPLCAFCMSECCKVMYLFKRICQLF